jgi:hypothetical protein
LKWAFELPGSGMQGILIPVVMIFAGFLVYIGTLWFLDNGFVLRTKSLLRQAASF